MRSGMRVFAAPHVPGKPGTFSDPGSRVQTGCAPHKGGHLEFLTARVVFLFRQHQTCAAP